MQRLMTALGLVPILLSTILITTPRLRAQQAELRAFWVDAFGPGIYNETQIEKLVADAIAANVNTLVVQVGRRGDCFCNNAIMPRTEDPNVAPYPFDPLQTVIDKAHAAGLEVHAWIVATAIWNKTTPPESSDHVFNTHGPSAEGYDNWIMLRYDGANRAGSDYLLDPGHPDAADYIVKMATSIVANYAVDGINLDRIRYPDYNLSEYPNASAWGYNQVAIERFQAATGRSDTPEPDDPEWMQWRRDQIATIVRRIYLDSYAIKPYVKVSADTITYGYGPETQGGWENTRTYREVLQDWRGWMEEGILDINMPMNYKREHYTTEPNNQQRMYEEWNEYIMDHQYNRHAVIGSGLYLNYIEGSITQVRKALAPSAAGNYARGWIGYSYRTPDYLALTGDRTSDESRAELIRALTEPSEYDSITPPVFENPAPVPELSWKTQPTTGHLRGTARDASGQLLDQARIDLYEAGSNKVLASRITDGLGWFGFVDLAPGDYEVKVYQRGGKQQTATTATIIAGQVTTVEVTQ